MSMFGYVSVLGRAVLALVSEWQQLPRLQRGATGGRAPRATLGMELCSVGAMCVCHIAFEEV